MRPHEAEIYAVANMKHGEITHLVAGPFICLTRAEAAMKELPEPSGSCYLEIVQSKLEFNPVWS